MNHGLFTSYNDDNRAEDVWNLKP